MTVTLALALTALMLLIAGCGGSDSPTSSSPTRASSPTTDSTAPDSGSDRGSDEKGDAGKRAEGDREAGEEGKREGDNDSGGDSGSGEEPGSSSSRPGRGPMGEDTSIQEFGKEASTAEREASSRTLEAFFAARAASDNETACASLSRVAREQLAELAAASPKIKAEGCVGAFDSIDQAAPPSARANPMAGPVSNLRVEGDRAFAIFPGKGGATYAIQMAKDGSVWKAAAIVPYRLN